MVTITTVLLYRTVMILQCCF